MKQTIALDLPWNRDFPTMDCGSYASILFYFMKDEFFPGSVAQQQIQN